MNTVNVFFDELQHQLETAGAVLYRLFIRFEAPAKDKTRVILLSCLAMMRNDAKTFAQRSPAKMVQAIQRELRNRLRCVSRLFCRKYDAFCPVFLREGYFCPYLVKK